MKKIILFLIIGFIVGCSSDDSTTLEEVTLVGTWLRISAIDEDGEEFVEEDDCPFETIISKTTVTARSYYGENCSLVSDAGYVLQYTLDGNFIIFELGTETSSLEILELTSTTLKIKEGDDLYYNILTYIRQ